jgi:imidazolonepropionase-like amidohydrolase
VDRSTLTRSLVAAAWLLVGTGSAVNGQSAAITVFEGGRLINGDGSVVENAAFAVQGNRIVAVGRAADMPLGGARVDITGKTVIPALIDAHSHIGYMRNLGSGPQNYTRENILDHMHKFAYFGVAASLAMGSDFGDLPFRLRDETRDGVHPYAARFLTAGRGLAPIDEIKPNNMRHSAHLVTTEDDARQAVADLAANGVEMVKTWVDTRGGTIRKLTPPLYEAIIEEAHKRKMRVVVHATGLVDVKALIRAGMDGFAHMVNDVDDELMDLLKAKPDTFFMLALGGLRRQMHAPWIDPPHALVSDTVWPEQIKRLRDRLAKPAPFANQSWTRLSRGIARFAAADVRVGVGTDGGGQQGDQFVGWTMHTELENMVAGGMSPGQALVAGTRTSAAILKLNELGMVAPGKSADFIVLDANPLDDITNTRRIVSVYLRGHEIPRPAMRSRWQAEFATAAAAR